MATFTKEFSSKLCKTIRYCFWRICTLSTRKYSIHSADLVLQNSNQSWEVSQTNNTGKNDLICGVIFIFLIAIDGTRGKGRVPKNVNKFGLLPNVDQFNLSSSSGVIHLSSFPMLKLFTISHCLSSI